MLKLRKCWKICAEESRNTVHHCPNSFSPGDLVRRIRPMHHRKVGGLLASFTTCFQRSAAKRLNFPYLAAQKVCQLSPQRRLTSLRRGSPMRPSRLTSIWLIIHRREMNRKRCNNQQLSRLSVGSGADRKGRKLKPKDGETAKA